MPSLLPFSFYFGTNITQIFVPAAQIVSPSPYNQTVVATLGHVGKLGAATTVLSKIEQKFPAVTSVLQVGVPSLYKIATSNTAKVLYTMSGGMGALMGLGVPMAVTLIGAAALGLGEMSSQKRKSYNAQLTQDVMMKTNTSGKQVASPNIAERTKRTFCTSL